MLKHKFYGLACKKKSPNYFLNHCLNQSSNHQMDSPSTPKNKRSFPNESPRTQRTCVEKKQIIDYYNSIKEIYGAKAKTVKKFELKSTSAF